MLIDPNVGYSFVFTAVNETTFNILILLLSKDAA